MERPADLPPAIAAIDALTWRGARPALLGYLADVVELDQLLARAHVYRLITAIIQHAGTPDLGPVAATAQPVTDLICTRLSTR